VFTFILPVLRNVVLGFITVLFIRYVEEIKLIVYHFSSELRKRL